MSKYQARRQRPAIAAIVLATHLLLAWLWLLFAQEPSRRADPEPVPLYTRIIDETKPEPLATPPAVTPALVPVTRPKPVNPELQPFEVEALDSPAPRPDPAASSSQFVTRPGPATDGRKGDPTTVGETGLKVVRRVTAIYPRDSMLRGESGLVQMRARVDTRGQVTEVQLVGSSGFNTLDAAAVRAVGKWRFEPKVQDGRSVNAWTLVNLRMSTYQQSYCRIRDEPTGANGEDVHDGAAAAATLGDEATLKRLINDLATGALQAPDLLRALLRDWGPVQSIHYVNDAGYQGWVTRDILPAYQGSRPGNTVQVRWDAYEVQYERIFTRWIVATDSTGETWCVRIGRAALHPWP